MRLSRKSDYALRALLYLASGQSPAPVSVRELAESNDIPRKFLEAIMRELRELGLVESLAGKNGGYRLLRFPGEISIGCILRHFDGHLEPVDPELLDDLAPDENLPTAQVRRVLCDIGNAVDQLMNETTLDHVLNNSPIRYRISNTNEFQDGGGI